MFVQIHLSLAFKQVVGVYIEIAPMPETLKLKLAVYSSFVCALIFSTTVDRQGQMWVHGWAAKETNLYKILLHSGIQHDNRSLDRVTMVYCNKRNYKNANQDL